MEWGSTAHGWVGWFRVSLVAVMRVGWWCHGGVVWSGVAQSTGGLGERFRVSLVAVVRVGWWEERGTRYEGKETAPRQSEKLLAV